MEKKKMFWRFFFYTFNLFLLLIDQVVEVCKNDTAVRRQHFDLCRSDVEVLQSPPPPPQPCRNDFVIKTNRTPSLRDTITLLCDAAGRVSAQHNSRVAREKKLLRPLVHLVASPAVEQRLRCVLHCVPTVQAVCVCVCHRVHDSISVANTILCFHKPEWQEHFSSRSRFKNNM